MSGRDDEDLRATVKRHVEEQARIEREEGAERLRRALEENEGDR